MARSKVSANHWLKGQYHAILSNTVNENWKDTIPLIAAKILYNDQNSIRGLLEYQETINGCVCQQMIKIKMGWKCYAVIIGCTLIFWSIFCFRITINISLVSHLEINHQRHRVQILNLVNLGPNRGVSHETAPLSSIDDAKKNISAYYHSSTDLNNRRLSSLTTPKNDLIDFYLGQINWCKYRVTWFQTIGDLVSKETVCCVGWKMKQ